MLSNQAGSSLTKSITISAISLCLNLVNNRNKNYVYNKATFNIIQIAPILIFAKSQYIIICIYNTLKLHLGVWACCSSLSLLRPSDSSSSQLLVHPARAIQQGSVSTSSNTGHSALAVGTRRRQCCRLERLHKTAIHTSTTPLAATTHVFSTALK